MNFEFLAGKPRATIWFPLFLNSAYSKTPRCKFSCFYPEVHDMAEKCHISAPLVGRICEIGVHFRIEAYKFAPGVFWEEYNTTYFKCNTMIFSDHNINNNNFKVK